MRVTVWIAPNSVRFARCSGTSKITPSQISFENVSDRGTIQCRLEEYPLWRKAMPYKVLTDVSRRKFLATAAVVGVAAPSIMRAQVRERATRRSSRDRLEEALARITDPKGEGKRACLTVYANAALAADAADARARSGNSLGPLDGIIISIKDAFDVAGEPTRAGSKILADAPPAAADAPTVRRLRSAGAVIVAKTNMVEFAYGGIGQNPHYGTPGNPA